MTYSELTALLQETVENEFTAEQLALFFQAAEERIFNVAQPPVLRAVQSATLPNGTRTLALPAGFLYPLSLAVELGSGEYEYLIPKDVEYIRSAYPNPITTGVPKVYALQDATTAVVGPTPGATYSVELQYARYPASITAAGTSWLGDSFPSTLLNLAVVEAGKFLKLEQDTMAVYDKMAIETLALYKNAADGKLRQDTYRTEQVRTPAK